jgi:SPP1 family predicted phage head-tail adaptor
MRAGSHDRQITIERKVVTPDPTYGTDVVTWTPLVVQPGSPSVAERFWAEVQDVLPSRDESLQQGALVMLKRKTRIRLRFRTDITSDMRVTVHGDTNAIYQIIGGPAEIEGRRERIEIMCEEYSS